MAFTPTPCPGCGGGGADGTDVEQNLLCDILPDGSIAGTALAVYDYDSDGNPSGPPTFVDPATGDPYVAQGELMPCPGELGCTEPVQFCFTTTSTGPVDHPGRQYDIELPINPGFAVQSLQVDQVTSPANIVWDVADPDGEQFRQDLTAFIEGRVPAAATVTITNPNAGVPQVCGAAQPMMIHIECLRLDQSPPDLIELVYNGGQDMIQNPAYNESPALNPPVSQGDYGFRLLRRQDDPGTPAANAALCTNTPNRGWETNDAGSTFEIWGRNIVQGEDVTPTPRGTPVQEITSDGPPAGGISTIWQTFQAPVSGDFVIRVVHGARDSGEIHRITLDNGDTDDAQNGDLIDDVSTPPSVTESGGPNPWTQFNQTIPLVGGNTYTLALSTTENPPDGNARGGLFTDMRAFIDRPDQRATALVDDDTCVVTVEETTTVQDPQWWAPMCDNGVIASWRNVETGQVLNNSQFWSQTPAPGRCSDQSTSGEGGSVAANLVHTYSVCAIVGGVPTTLQRVVITDPSGGGLFEQFIGPDGAPVAAPADYTIGSCSDAAFVNDEILCDDNGPFLRKYVQSVNPSTNQGQIQSHRDFTLAGAVYAPVGAVGNCGGNQTLGPVCWSDPDLPELIRQGFMGVNSSGDPVLRDLSGNVIADYTVVICPEITQQSHILCDQGNGGHQFLRWYVDSPIDGGQGVQWNLELDGQTDYEPVGPVGLCGDTAGESSDAEVMLLCDSTAPTPVRFLRRYIYSTETGSLIGFADTTLDGSTVFNPVGAVGVCTTPVATDFDFAEEILCDSNGTQFIRRFRFNSQTGLLDTTTNLTLAGGAFAPVGAVSVCANCCPQVIGSGCSNTGSGAYTAIRAANGTVTLIDSVTGAAITGANIIACDAAVGTAVRHLTGVTSVDPKTLRPGLQSVTLTVLAGEVTATTTDGAVSIPAGVSLTWSVTDTDDASLTTASFAGVAADADFLVHWTYKATAAG